MFEFCIIDNKYILYAKNEGQFKKITEKIANSMLTQANDIFFFNLCNKVLLVGYKRLYNTIRNANYIQQKIINSDGCYT